MALLGLSCQHGGSYLESPVLDGDQGTMPMRLMGVSLGRLGFCGSKADGCYSLGSLTWNPLYGL